MSTVEPKKLRIRPYQDFLTPAWHRKFTTAATLTYAACFLLAIASSPKSGGWIWTFFRVLVQTLILFIAALIVFIMRVSATTVGTRTSASPFKTLLSGLFRFTNIKVGFLYLFSAWLYTETFVFAAESTLNIHMIRRTSYGKQLNERAILFRLSVFVTAVVQAAWHLYADKSRNSIPIPTKSTDSTTELESGLWPALRRIWEQAQFAGVELVEKAFFSFIASIVLYYGLLRAPLWELNFNVFSTLGQLDRYSRSGSIAPAMSLFGTMFFQSLFLVALWDFSNLAYDALVSQEPLKLGQPLTDGSQDPNGTLINGLGSKKNFARTNAFWELLIIITRFPARRATIFIDVDRQPTATWTQISQLCLDELQGITTRIQALNAPAAAPPPVAPLRQPVAQPLKQGSDLFAQSPPAIGLIQNGGAVVGSVGKSIGQSPGQGYKPVLQVADYARTQAEKALPAGLMDRVDANAFKSWVNWLLIKIVELPLVGTFFRQTFAKRATAVVCGAPHSHAITIVAAARSLSLLVVHSLKEDRFGEVQKDVAKILRTFNMTLQAINGFMAQLQPHWSDVEFTAETRGNCEEVEAVRDALNDGLRAMVGAFGEYAGTIGLAPADLSQAKALIGAEMRERKLLPSS